VRDFYSLLETQHCESPCDQRKFRSWRFYRPSLDRRLPWIWLVGCLIRGVPELRFPTCYALSSWIRRFHVQSLVWRLPTAVCQESGILNLHGLRMPIRQMLNGTTAARTLARHTRSDLRRSAAINSSWSSCVSGSWRYFCYMDDIRHTVHELISIVQLENCNVVILQVLAHLLFRTYDHWEEIGDAQSSWAINLKISCKNPMKA
jgi:hypothetical protein